MVTLSGVHRKAARTAFASESIVHGNGFEQGRFAGAVFTGEETDTRMQHQFIKAADGWNRKWIAVPIFNPVTQKFDLLEHGKPRFVRQKRRLNYIFNSITCAFTFLAATTSLPTLTGKLKRRGPALPGLK